MIADALQEEGKSPEGMRVAVQGFGNVGKHLARMLAEEGAIVIAVSDSGGGLHAPNGLDMQGVLAHKSEHGTLAGFAGADAISNEELLLLECDVLAPCALEQVISVDNAAQVKARIVCEGANGPVTPASTTTIAATPSAGNTALTLLYVWIAGMLCGRSSTPLVTTFIWSARGSRAPPGARRRARSTGPAAPARGR